MNFILAPVTTERAVSQIEKLNKIAFFVSVESTKDALRKEATTRFSVVVKKINVRKRPDGKKVAVLTLTKSGEAAGLASKLKIL